MFISCFACVLSVWAARELSPPSTLPSSAFQPQNSSGQVSQAIIPLSAQSIQMTDIIAIGLTVYIALGWARKLLRRKPRVVVGEIHGLGEVEGSVSELEPSLLFVPKQTIRKLCVTHSLFNQRYVCERSQISSLCSCAFTWPPMGSIASWSTSSTVCHVALPAGRWIPAST